jgi:hypothetical protein
MYILFYFDHRVAAMSRRFPISRLILYTYGFCLFIGFSFICLILVDLQIQGSNFSSVKGQHTSNHECFTSDYEMFPLLLSLMYFTLSTA